MKARIVSALAGAAAFAIRRLGPVQAYVVVRPAAAPTLVPNPDGRPARNTALIKIDLDLSR